MKWLRRLGLGVWTSWPDEAYCQERYQQRLVAVQGHLSDSLDVAARGPVRIVSICAGDGRDVIGVLTSHRRRTDVAAWMIERSRKSVAAGVCETARAGLGGVVHFLEADATDFANYRNVAPADIFLVCGVWGHVPAEERAQLVRAIATLCKPGGTVIWTRGISQGLSRLHEIQSLFCGSEWETISTSVTSDMKWAVASHRYCGPPGELPVNGRMFHFSRSDTQHNAARKQSLFFRTLSEKSRCKALT